MKLVPGVMTLESQAPFFLGGTFTLPSAVSCSRMASSTAWPSRASWAERKRRARCWFILARGATPSMARYRHRRGRTARNSRSTYRHTFSYISTSLAGCGPCSGWEHGWMMPFMSMYRLSHSRPDGLGRVESNGTRIDPDSDARWTRSSSTSLTILGYFSDSHR